MSGKIYKALILSPKDETVINIYNPGFLVVSSSGTIEEVSDSDPSLKYKDYKLIDYSDYLICPGFIDIHNHLPQYAFVGIGEKELLPWLERYTFPREKMFEEEAVARDASEVFFKDLIKNGTTTTVTYVTVHKSAVDIAFESAKRSGVRAVIGKVMMDQNSPEFLQEETEQSLEDSEELIKKWNGVDDRLYYVLTPRFAITCSFELMKKVGELAKSTGVYIQTHLSENKGEVEYTKELFPDCANYTDVYNKAGILGPKTIMAHCIYLDADEISLLKKTDTKVAHCPTSNRFLRSGIMPFRKYRDVGLKMGIGTDVAGGYSLSMFNEMKEAIENSKYQLLYSGDKEKEPMTVAEAFYLATLGGAKVLSIDDQIGSLEVGKKADFLVVDHIKCDPMGKKSTYTEPEQILSKLIYRGSELNIKEVCISGAKIL